MPLAALPRDDDALLARTGIDPLPPAREGLFRNGGWLRRIHAESALILGGGRFGRQNARSPCFCTKLQKPRYGTACVPRQRPGRPAQRETLHGVAGGV